VITRGLAGSKENVTQSIKTWVEREKKGRGELEKFVARDAGEI
jgi:hypothetical protein